jgi:hypothetical protein
MKLLGPFLLLPFLPLLAAFSYEALLFIVGLKFEEVQFFLLGAVIYLFLYVIFLKGKIRFLETLEHELTHAAASIALVKMPTKLVVDVEKGGMVERPKGCFLISLAPYFLPLFTLPLLLLKPIVPAPFDNVVDFLIGFTLAFHCVQVINSLRVEQTDITKTGTIVSVPLLVFLNLIFLVVILAVVSGNYGGILDYFQASWERTKEFYNWAIELVKSFTLPEVAL